MTKYKFENCKICGDKLYFEEETDTCIGCRKRKQFYETSKTPCTSDIFLMKMRKYNND